MLIIHKTGLYLPYLKIICILTELYLLNLFFTPITRRSMFRNSFSINLVRKIIQLVTVLEDVQQNETKGEIMINKKIEKKYTEVEPKILETVIRLRECYEALYRNEIEPLGDNVIELSFDGEKCLDDDGEELDSFWFKLVFSASLKSRSDKQFRLNMEAEVSLLGEDVSHVEEELFGTREITLD